MKRFLYSAATDRIKGWPAPVIQSVLWVLSQVYLVLIALRKLFYKFGVFAHYRLPVPVISVGNLTVGGAGKTPLVEFIAQALKKKNIQPVILMRGYMGTYAGGRGSNSDEATMLKNSLGDTPILVGADRVRNAKEFLKNNKADAFLLDDGFQHWRLSRDLDIVAIDATNPWGNGHALPRGVLRESKQALSRAHIFVLTKTDLGAEKLERLKADLSAINPNALIVETVHRPILFTDLRSGKDLELATAQGQRISAISAIGDPDSFERALTGLGVKIDKHFAFIDHYMYAPGDIARIGESCRHQGVTTIVTTEKDAVKLKPLMNSFSDDIRILSLKIKISIISGEDGFLERISHIL